ncbi:acVLRF1 family peptidyl-tRNA hydrolase [Streptoalloteichus hindustanus]|uniref:Actinobacteria/chloroflexi VLRF1 release factor domain-containing protein n=1 Tax=Streptoalloteichus hindustanus TaxID=2017 RepID=A0A1M4YEE9_STRHI|nr:acVLRF1 family peptidyl-tRNA hydrolase [Streptoalloteichus hindustanus]SHF04157.1 hypothetical protein SAMN05444320_102332 [Streptoalloteichus hindustanus]
MSRTRQVAGGGRAVEVAPERLASWFDRFAQRHDGVRRTVLAPERVEVHGADGARVEVDVPFGPLDVVPREEDGLAVEPLVAHLLRPRRIGLVLVRLGGCSVGVAEGGRVALSSTERRQVHGRNKAGGWSQQRFARRREGQARESLRAAADTAARVLLPVAAELDAVVLGGDRTALAALREDRRLAALFARAEPRVLDVPEPRRAVLDEAAERARCAEVVVFEP